ncbi:uracil-xanthine permease [Acidaminobacter sp. JC074]|uniref:uracil-xanthine permease family protein n=1 Tax=Acidaminobacter sp. JC074 TaxID=2530199 RepID=UPI001F0F97F0|nr:uracil-xanthine permease family protein [Acidaminobacter sp. JC074]MCH4887608.1 uracil-xanthine permease [Acidaminobacter sp. JC074]
MDKKLSARNFILGLQHLVAMFGATVLVPAITGFNPAVALFAAGCGTLIFHFVTKRKVPVFLGSSFSFIAVILAVKEMHGGDLRYAQGGLLVAGLVYVIISLFIGKVKLSTIHKILPPYVIGPMIMIIGLTLLPVAVDMASAHFLLAGLTLVYVVLINKFATGLLKQMSILLAVVLGYSTALVIGMVSGTPIVDFSVVTQANLLAFPEFTTPKFSAAAIFTIVPIVLAVFMEHIGDVTTNGTVVGQDFLKDPGLNRTLLGDGLATMFAAMIGGPANTTYGENTSVLAITKNYDPRNLRIAAVFAILLALFGKFGAILQTIPVAVMGGISFMLFGMIAWIGVRMIKDNKVEFNAQSIIVMVVMLTIGLGTSYLSKYAGITIGVKLTETVMLTGLSLAAISGVVLNLVLNLVFKTEIKDTEERRPEAV